jgi:hypothetical protein
VRRDREEPILDVMQEDQQPTEWEDCYRFHQSYEVTDSYFLMWPLFVCFLSGE